MTYLERVHGWFATCLTIIPICVNFQIVKAVQCQIPVFLDGGVRRGTDVFKALALGASGVFVSDFVLLYST